MLVFDAHRFLAGIDKVGPQTYLSTVKEVGCTTILGSLGETVEIKRNDDNKYSINCEELNMHLENLSFKDVEDFFDKHDAFININAKVPVVSRDSLERRLRKLGSMYKSGYKKLMENGGWPCEENVQWYRYLSQISTVLDSMRVEKNKNIVTNDELLEYFFRADIDDGSDLEFERDYELFYTRSIFGNKMELAMDVFSYRNSERGRMRTVFRMVLNKLYEIELRTIITDVGLIEKLRNDSLLTIRDLVMTDDNHLKTLFKENPLMKSLVSNYINSFIVCEYLKIYNSVHMFENRSLLNDNEYNLVLFLDFSKMWDELSFRQYEIGFVNNTVFGKMIIKLREFKKDCMSPTHMQTSAKKELLKNIIPDSVWIRILEYDNMNVEDFLNLKEMDYYHMCCDTPVLFFSAFKYIYDNLYVESTFNNDTRYYI